MAYRIIDFETIAKLRDAIPDAVFVGWYPDQLDGMSADFIKTNCLMDAFMATGAGTHLQEIARQSNNIPDCQAAAGRLCRI